MLRISAGGTKVLEPIVANDPNSPCVAQPAGIGTLPTDPIPVDLTLLYAKTSLTAPQAKAGVADVAIRLSALNPSLPDITAQVLTSQASATCSNGVLSRTGKSRVVGLQIAGQGGEIPPGDAYENIDASPLVRVQLNETDKSKPNTLTQRALHITVLPGAASGADVIDVVVAESSVDTTGNPCVVTTTPPPTSVSPSPSGSPGPVVGWMTGGGQLPGSVTHSLVLPCTTTQKHPNPHLHVETPNGTFDLTKLTQVGCSFVPANGNPEQPDAGFNTLSGSGTGDCNGHHGVDASFTFTDGGEPNKGNDKATVSIDNGNKYGCHVSITGATVNGNQQAHRGNNPPA